MKLLPLTLNKLAKGMFVLVETTDDCVEIGIVRPNTLHEEKELKIFLLTESGFEDLPPKFDPNWLPFMVPMIPDIDPSEYPSYDIEPHIVEGLLTEQKNYLHSENEKAKVNFDAALQRHDEKIVEFENQKKITQSLFNSFCSLESMITELRK